MEPLTVVCVYSRGSGFTDEYVTRLRDAVQKHCSAPHRFVCITNHELPGIETIKRAKAWKGWWIKLELFRQGLFDGPVVYFDLDTLILGDITDILTYPHDFSTCSNWKSGRKATHMSSAVMAWDGREDLSHVFHSFHPSMIHEYEQSWERWGDQARIAETINRPWQSLLEIFPDRLIHYKTHILGPTKNPNAQIPEKASIVCLSGRPRPHELAVDSVLYKAWIGR